jgi:tRNA (guanine26-N2/guanine27-N2)-dimethyltransferase
MKEITEGSAKLAVPSESLRKKSETFYNPAMELQRNVTIAALRVSKPKEVLDPLAATGIRGIRILKEVEGTERIVFNDRNPTALRLIEKNLKLNKIPKKRYEIHRKDANSLFLEKIKYDYVDIDPFGSPAKFLSGVVYSLKKGSLLGVTATDSGALAGKFANACFRRYGVLTARTDFPKEMGVRVLITSIIKNLAVHEMTFVPLYSHGNHYFRVIGRMERSPDKDLKKIRMVSYCRRCLERKIGIYEKCKCGERMTHIGPIWTGQTHDNEFCRKMLTKFDFPNAKEITLCSHEIDEPFYYDIHELARLRKTSPPKIEKIIESLKSNGFKASRTHFANTGIKTDAELMAIGEVPI